MVYEEGNTEEPNIGREFLLYVPKNYYYFKKLQYVAFSLRKGVENWLFFNNFAYDVGWRLLLRCLPYRFMS